MNKILKVGVREFRTRLSEMLAQIAFAGLRVIVTWHGKPLVAFVSIEDLKLLDETAPQEKREA